MRVKVCERYETTKSILAANDSLPPSIQSVKSQKQLTSEKPTGSKSLDVFPPSPQRKGMGSGPSPPTRPLANSFSDVAEVRAGDDGAKAAAAPAEAARSAAVNLAMVACRSEGALVVQKSLDPAA